MYTTERDRAVIPVATVRPCRGQWFLNGILIEERRLELARGTYELRLVRGDGESHAVCFRVQ